MFDLDEEIQLLDPIEEFYSKPLYYSYSALKKLIWSPQVYYKHYILGEKEESLEKHMIEGKVIHCLLLNNGTFDQQFIISPVTLPTGNTKLVIDKVFKIFSSQNRRDMTHLNHWSNEILQILRDINLHQSLRTDQQRLDKIQTEESQSYFSYLISKGAKDVIDQPTLEYCQAAAELFRNHVVIKDLLGIDKTEDVINEKEFRVNLVNYPFGLKGIVDNLNIDHTKKIIYINDIKTSGKGLEEFSETVEFYKYWMQAAIYLVLIQTHFSHLTEQGYTIEFRFIVIDRNLQLYPFKVEPKTLNKWMSNLEEVLSKAKFHYEEREYILPYEYAKGLVSL